MTLLKPLARFSLVSMDLDNEPFWRSMNDRAVSATPPAGGFEVENVGGMGVPAATALESGRGGVIDFGIGAAVGRAVRRACRRRFNSPRTGSLSPVASLSWFTVA